MYLVLTALLALNVSKEVLDAFVLVDNGLQVTTEAFAAKNATAYSRFAFLNENNAEKVGIWNDRAIELKAKTDELYDFIQQCKLDIIGDNDQKAIHDGHYDWHEVKVKDNLEIGATVMITDEGGRRYKELKGMIDGLREYSLSIIDDHEKYASTVETIENNLSTAPPDKLQHKKPKKGETMTWEQGYFESLPLASVITLLSKMQADARNVEAEMLNYLLGQVDAGAVPVNTLKAVVIPERSLVFKGEEYKARVMLAAYDSTKMPEVQLEDGTMLPVEGGMGIYTATSSTPGVRSWAGTIQLENEGSVLSRPFEATYEVAEPSATISPTAMLVFYRGIPNPVAISVGGGVSESDISVRISPSGSITPTGRTGQYIVKPGVRGDEATVSVYANVDGSSRLMNSSKFRVKNLPVPDARVEGIKGSSGSLSVGQLTRLREVKAVKEDFLFEVTFEVQSFNLAFQDRSGKWATIPSDRNRISSQQRNILQTLSAGQRISFEDIKAVGPDGNVNVLNTINIKAQ